MPLGSNRDRHANVGEGLIGERLSVFLGRPRLQGLPAVLETLGHDGKGGDGRHARARAPLAPGHRRLTCASRSSIRRPTRRPTTTSSAARSRRPAPRWSSLTAHFTHGEAPVAARLRAPRAVRAAARRPDRAPPRLAVRGSRSRRPGTRVGLARLVRRAARLAARHHALAVGALARARPAGRCAPPGARPARPCSRRTTCCRGARATPRRCGPSSTRAATA